MEYNAQNPTMRPGRHPDGLICPTGAQTQWRGTIPQNKTPPPIDRDKIKCFIGTSGVGDNNKGEQATFYTKNTNLVIFKNARSSYVSARWHISEYIFFVAVFNFFKIW